MEVAVVCPSCNGALMAVLDMDAEAEVQAVGCEYCGHTFFAQRPEKKKKKKKKPKAPPPPPLSVGLLEAADDETSNAVIAAFADDATFRAFAKAEMDGILARDAEDDEKLAAGIKMAVKKGVVPKKPKVERTHVIDVLGKSADAVAGEIIAALGSAPKRGCVLVLQGLSGTGKGTTVAKLAKLLPRASMWSNGNVFRALTLLAVTYCESHGLAFGPEALTPQLLAELMQCLSFGKNKAGEFDIRISGLGIDAMVSQVANTTLKEPRVSKNIPTVAKMTQGEVITFASAAAAQMGADGMNVLMEGRAQTLNYVRTPHRFELTLSQPLIIGMRRAAQRMIAAAAEPCRKQMAAAGGHELTAEVVKVQLDVALATMAMAKA